MSGVFQNLESHSLTARRVCTPLPLVRGEDTLAGWRGVGGSIVRKTPDTALYSKYVSVAGDVQEILQPVRSLYAEKYM